MIIYQRELINWDIIHKRRRNQQVKNNKIENIARSDYEYRVEESVLTIKIIGQRTGKLMNLKHEGPFSKRYCPCGIKD